MIREIVRENSRENCRENSREILKMCREICREISKMCRENFANFRVKNVRPKKIVKLRGGSPFFSREICCPENPRENFENPRDNPRGNPREILPRVIARFPRDFCWGVISRRILSTKLWGEALSGTCAPPDCLRRYTTWLCLGSAGICGPGLVYLVCPH